VAWFWGYAPSGDGGLWQKLAREQEGITPAASGTGSTGMTGAQFEISIDGVPRTYRDQKDLALLAAQILKSKNPNSVVRLKDLESGAEIVIAFKAAQQ
jgi:hypothetical protein